MKSIEAYRRLHDFGSDVLSTLDAAAILGMGSSHASRVLERLSESGRIARLKRGAWAFSDRIDPLQLPEHLTAPLPSYVSLHSALFHHGMVSQIPEVIYAVSPARTRRWSTPLATVSIHHLAPSFFFGFESVGKRSIKMAIPEKALLDCLYLIPASSRLFARLPELELPESFDGRLALEMVERVPTQRLRTVILQRLRPLLHACQKLS